ncbi:MAG: hypothetical protein WCE79_00330 [Xanthobacteraceae bacterium]
MLAAAAIVSSPVGAETFSIRCDAHETKKSYVLTFDTDSKRLVYESTLGNLHRGRITGMRDPYVSFAVKGDTEIAGTWDGKQRSMYWPGLPDEVRPTLHHNCTAIEPRTVLLPPRTDSGPGERPAAPFSIRCNSEPFPSHFTFDRASRQALMESMAGIPSRGEILEADGSRIRFMVETGHVPPFSMTWDRQAGAITIEGVPGEPPRPTTVMACSEIAPRSILEMYDRLR